VVLLRTGEKKKLHTRYGEIEIATSHAWSQGLLAIQISPYFQELYIYGGQSDNYEKACAWMNKYLRTAVNSSQMERLTQGYGELLSSSNTDSGVDISVLEDQIASFSKELTTESVVYIMADGSMLPTREGETANDWREAKLGRIFDGNAIVSLDKHHNKIAQSAYVADLGDSTIFCEKMDIALATLQQNAIVPKAIVFINDGGPWLWNWIQSQYPEYPQILDYYHASQKLSIASKLAYAHPPQAREWLAIQQQRLLNDEIQAVLLAISSAKSITSSVTKQGEFDKVYNYMFKHQDRMLYKTFREKGYLIGSGPIESAHRVVLQKRLKQSGQRWTKKGAQNVINLRVMFENHQWDKVISLIKHKEKIIYNLVA
jgi:hypothetical protein